MSDSPKFTDGLYENRKEALAVMNAFKGGKATAKKLLNKWEREGDKGYKWRQDNSTLFNQTRKTIKTANGMIFRKDISLIDLDADFMKRIEDIDDADTNFNEFAKDTEESSLWDGISYVLVDVPRHEGEVASLAQQKALGLVPYFIKYEANQVLNRRIENGKLIQITLKETVTEYEGKFKEKSVEQERVLFIGGGAVYRDNILQYEWTNNLSYIPIVPFYSNKAGFFDATPRYLDLAELNLKHYNYQSQLDKTLFIASNPIPVISGDIDNETQVDIGVDKAVKFERVGEGKFEWVEFAGTSVDKLQAEIKNIEERMLSIGISILTQKEQTATEAGITSAGETSDLSSMASSLEKSLNLAYSYWCDLMGKPTIGEITVNRDFTGVALSPAEAKMYLEMYQAGTITLAQFWDEMEKREFLGEVDRELALAELEARNQNTDLLG